MRTVTFQSIYEGVLSRFGLDASGDILSQSADMSIARNATLRVKMAMDMWDWPELSRTEERAFRPIWDSTVSYHEIGDEGNPDEFYYTVTDTYYKVNSIIGGDPPAGTLPTNAGYFEVIESPEPFIARDQIGRISIGNVLGVYPVNPSLNGNADHLLTFQPSERGIKVNGVYNNNYWFIAPNPPDPVSPTTVFLWYLILAPEYSMKPYIDFKQYHIGDIVFYAPPTGDGNCYRALGDTRGNAPTNIDFWVMEPVPSLLADYIEAGTYADCLREGINGAPPDALSLQVSGAAEAEAQGHLQREIDKLLSQGQKHFYGGAQNWRWTGVWASQPWNGDKVLTLDGPTPTIGFTPPPTPTGSAWEVLTSVVSIDGIPLSLRQVSTTNRKALSMVTIVIGPSGNRDKSTWQLLSGPALVGDAGQVAPLDYNLITNNVHWELVGD